MSDTLFGQRVALTGGEEFNDLELRRALYMDMMGGSVGANVSERNLFIDIRRCVKHDELQTNLGQWLLLCQEYGSGLPAAHLQLMLHNMIPANV